MSWWWFPYIFVIYFCFEEHTFSSNSFTPAKESKEGKIVLFEKPFVARKYGKFWFILPLPVWHNWSTPKHKPKHRLAKWVIISGDSVRPYLHTYVCTYVQNTPFKEWNHFSSWCFGWNLDVDHCTTQVLLYICWPGELGIVSKDFFFQYWKKRYPGCWDAINSQLRLSLVARNGISAVGAIYLQMTHFAGISKILCSTLIFNQVTRKAWKIILEEHQKITFAKCNSITR